MGPAAFGMVTVLATLCLVVGFLLLSVYEEQVMDIKRRPLRVLTRISIIFAWPFWALVTIIAIACLAITESFKALFK